MKITNAWICRINKNNVEPIFGDLTFTDGKISSIEEKSFEPKNVFAENFNEKDIINAGGRVVTIPNINFHDHFYSRLAKGLTIKGETDNFHNILKNLWWKLDLILDEEMIKASSQMAALESIRNGVTYIFDHHSSPQSANGSLKIISDILSEAGLRGVLCFESTDRNGKEFTKQGLNENIDFLQNQTDENIKGLFGLHASFTVDDESLKTLSEFVNNNDLGIHVHLCEDKVDRDFSLKQFNKSPADRFIDFKMLNDKSILAHGIHLVENDFRLIEKAGSAIVYNPDSNLNNAVGLADFSHVPDSIPILAGTDGMNSNPARSLKQLFLISRHRGMSFDESFKFINKIYFDQINFVKKYFPDFTLLNTNDRADLIIWDYIPPTIFNSENFFGHYVYGILDRPVHSVIQNGKVLMKNFQITIDETCYNAKIVEQGKRLYEKFNSIS
ncbi:MAG: amidohydrolase family protein [Ignavibacteria bacterium]|nr:amidohydrolase family protein [Ignavibacteria bacterium]MBT8383818.1 amidohydrolase family protein [Ignavibacteria bacterium]MBT8391579.1 amidohydrolase family protein [Ignavibacteria bacterium]NNJ53712.1 amidohydrolase family protein [Ignavibacteriaceae bacterium]NNL20776.1 amidohydrolase family protein [Ignavibacteriaceae bacterium]